MNLNRLATKRTLVVGAVMLAVCVGAGAAIAATKDVFDPKEEQEAFQAAVAEKLGVTTTELQNAYKAAALEQARCRRRRRQAHRGTGRRDPRADRGGRLPGAALWLRLRLQHHLEGGPGIEGAADYLGLTEDELHERLRNGQTLAEIARAEGKSVDGLEASAGRRREGEARPGGRGRPDHRRPARRAAGAARDEDRRPRQRRALPRKARTRLRTKVRRSHGRLVRPARAAERVARSTLPERLRGPSRPPRRLRPLRVGRRTSRRRCRRAPGAGARARTCRPGACSASPEACRQAVARCRRRRSAR